MFTQYTWRKFAVVKIRISKIREMPFYLTFGFLGFKVAKKWTINLFKGSEDFGFLNVIWLNWKYKPALLAKRHFKTRIEEHIKKDNKCHFFKHLHSYATCFDSYNSLSFKIIDKANSKFDLKIKEAVHIAWRKHNLNAQQNHLALTISL